MPSKVKQVLPAGSRVESNARFISLLPTVCQILPKGVVGVLGPSSSPASSSIISNICGEKEVSGQILCWGPAEILPPLPILHPPAAGCCWGSLGAQRLAGGLGTLHQGFEVPATLSSDAIVQTPAEGLSAAERVSAETVVSVLSPSRLQTQRPALPPPSPCSASAISCSTLALLLPPLLSIPAPQTLSSRCPRAPPPPVLSVLVSQLRGSAGMLLGAATSLWHCRAPLAEGPCCRHLFAVL